jgi:outer membrane protein OmpA-like peptidoglycan-associated protein
MNINKVAIIFSFILSILSFAYSSTAYVSPYLAYHYMDRTKNLKDSWEIGTYYTEKLSEAFFVDYNVGFIQSSVKSSGENTLLLGGGVNVLYQFEKIDLVTPYILAGIGGVGGYNARIGLDVGFGCFIKINDYFTPRLEIKNIYYGNTLGNDTIYQVMLSMPLEQNAHAVAEVIKPVAPEIKAPVKTSFKSELEEAFIKTGKVEKMNMKITFDSGASVVKGKYDVSLQKYAEFLINHPEIKLLIKGYTDNQGNKAFNQKLSEMRAKAVGNVLIYKYGINKKRIQIQGLGGVNPVATNKTEAGRALNRRIEASTI